MRLDRSLRAKTHCSKREASILLSQRKIEIDGVPTTDGTTFVDRFSKITVNSTALPRDTPYYVRLHKPAGILSATQDQVHTTVIELINETWKSQLHLAGRLDRASTGLILLTNDGRWSKSLTMAETKIKKTYIVHTSNLIDESVIKKFQDGFYFETEDIHTLPVRLEILTDYSCKLTLTEGRYHQIKRMFSRVQNKVTSLHRQSIGPYDLVGLHPGEYEIMDPQKIRKNLNQI